MTLRMLALAAATPLLAALAPAAASAVPAALAPAAASAVPAAVPTAVPASCAPLPALRTGGTPATPRVFPATAAEHGATQVARLVAGAIDVYTFADDGRAVAVTVIGLPRRVDRVLAVREGRILTETSTAPPPPPGEATLSGGPRVLAVFDVRRRALIGCFGDSGGGDGDVLTANVSGIYRTDTVRTHERHFYIGIPGTTGPASVTVVNDRDDFTPATAPGFPPKWADLTEDGTTSYLVPLYDDHVYRTVLTGPRRGTTALPISGLGKLDWTSVQLARAADRIAVAAAPGASTTLVAIVPATGGRARVVLTPGAAKVVGWLTDESAIVLTPTGPGTFRTYDPTAGDGPVLSTPDGPISNVNAVVAGAGTLYG